VRVTAHVFGEQALGELLEAGIDGIEHGTGLSDETIAVMAERQVALVPTLVQLENFEGFAAAGEQKYPTYAKHIRSLYARRLEVFAAAHDAGVPIYAGTDAGGYLPHGLVGTEMKLLGQFCSPVDALGAGSWRARAWLGRPDTLLDGDPADLVVFDNDPRTDLSVLERPRQIILRGRLVG
jgi:imidazolonepropionase-like amidohydrolase